MIDSLAHRTYQGWSDLQAMLDLLTAGRQADNGTYYVHRGDLQWWLFYNDDATQEWRSRVRLWTDAGRLIGWSLLSPSAWHAFDVYAEAIAARDRPRAGDARLGGGAVVRRPLYPNSVGGRG